MNDIGNDAYEFEKNDQLVKAADSYELAIRNGDAKLDDHMNLMALYFVSLDPGYAMNRGIPPEFSDRAFRRISELPEEIEMRFGECQEATFWREYTLFIVLGERPNLKKWRDFVESGSTVVPLIGLQEDLKSGVYPKQFSQLSCAVLTQNTIRSRYIASVLSSNVI